jgi:hypothetical protein
MQFSSSSGGPKTAMIKEVVVGNATEEVDLPHAGVGDEDIEAIKQFHGIKTLILDENSITNFDFFTICSSFPELRKLFINHNQISDDGLGTLPKLKLLLCLDLRCNRITSNALRPIAQLSLSNNQIGDGQLELRYLDITSNQITEAGGLQLGQFKQLKQLNNLYLLHNQTTLPASGSTSPSPT